MSELAIGLMSGTSLDGVDAALVEIEGAHTVRLVAFHTRPFDPTDRKAMLEVIAHGSAREIALLNVELARTFAAAGRHVLDESAVAAADLAFVASHGQTLWHEPQRATLQIGDPAVIAEELGVQVVSDFRSRDVAAGGQGAPLVPIADAMLFGHPDRGRGLLNLGGMANVTWVPRLGVIDHVIAFDTGPGVAVIDAVTREIDPEASFDRRGARAARGSPVVQVVGELLTHPYFAAPPPKSTGRETFGDTFAEELVHRVRSWRSDASDDDCVATAVELTARSIAEQVEQWIPGDRERDLLVSGGGAKNPTLMNRLQELLTGWDVCAFDALFFNGDAKEAVAFAYLGWRTLHGLPGNVPAATGARGGRILGSVTPDGTSEVR